MVNHRQCLRTLVSVALLPVGAEALALRVPSEYETINAALDAASDGDSVLVAPGVYDAYETRLLGDGIWWSAVGFLKGGATLIAEGGAGATTLRMDTTGGGRAVLRAFGASGTATVEGFTITGTVPQMNLVSYTWGGRCIIRDCVFRDFGTGGTSEVAVGSVLADVEIYNCRFENINGTGIGQTSGTLVVEDCEFEGIQSGALSVRYDSAFPYTSSLAVRGSRFLDNSDVGLGGAVAALHYPSVLLEDCWFEGNRCHGISGAGGAVIVSGSVTTDGIVRNCTFAANGAEDYGIAGALYTSARTMLVESCTFFESSQAFDWGEGGAAVFVEVGALTLRNSIIAGSTGTQAVGRRGGSLTSTCNVFWENASGDAYGFSLDGTDLPADPQFCEPEGRDFHVNGASPCLPGQGHPSCTELIGAWGVGCGTVSVGPSSWGRITNSFREGSGGTR